MTESSATSTSAMLNLRAPLARGMKVLDRAVFSKTFNLAAASVRDPRKIGIYKQRIIDEGKWLQRAKLRVLRPHPDQSLAASGQKCMLLNSSVKLDVPETWGPTIQEGVKEEEVDLIPYDLTIPYEDWTYDEVIHSILAPGDVEEIPAAFNQAGHVIHVNMKDDMQPYKALVGQVLLDKNPRFRTVINKVDDVGEASVYRTFSYEVLAGPDDMLVEINESGCIFKLDYAKVYWNSKLSNEHERLVNLFKPGEVVADVMAGVGPFAVPAGKKGVFVWANDMNPDSYRWMKEAAKRNKVEQYVMPFNEDGRHFITRVADLVYEASKQGQHALEYPKFKRSRASPTRRPPPTKVPLPRTISHFVMNLPASATTFIRHFKGLYAGKESLFAPHTDTNLPMVHVHCFAPKNSEDLPASWPGQTMTAEEVKAHLLQRVHDELGVRLKMGNPEVDGEMEAYVVRDVAPNKLMYCLAFRIPPEVAFAPRS